MKEQEMTQVTRENLNKHTIYVISNENEPFEKGTEIRLTNDDGSHCPKFTSLDGNESWYVELRDIHVYGQGPEDEIVEVTLSEVADKLGVDVEKLRIKD